MRTSATPTTLKTLALSQVSKYTKTFTVQNRLLRFSDGPTPASLTGSTLSFGVPTSYSYSSGSMYQGAFKSGSLTLSTLNLTTPNFDTTPILTLTPGPMRGSFYGSYFTAATWSWSGQPTIKRYNLNGTLAATWATVPETMVNNSTIIRRVEAVIDTGSWAVVAIGCHELKMQLSTIKFYLVNATTTYRLNTIIQIHMGDTTVTPTSWHDKFQYCANISAIDTGNGIVIVANDQINGRAVQFRWYNGIESQLEQVVPIDPDASDTTFMPTGLTKINTYYYLSGYFRRPKTDDTVDRLNVYLTSKDGWYWSVGERNHIVSLDTTKGQLVFNGTNTIYYIGLSDDNGTICSAPARVFDGYGTATDITAHVINWKFDNACDNADSLELTLDVPNLVHDNDVVTFDLGYTGATIVRIGEFVVTQAPTTVSFEGVDVTSVTLVDMAGFIYQDWHSPVDRDSWSSTTHEDNFDNLGSIVMKTPIRDSEIVSLKKINDPTYVVPTDVEITDGSLYSSSLNDPMVGYTTERDERDGMAYAEVTFQDTSDKCLQSFGFTFGGNTDHFNAVTFPKYSTWTGYVHSEPELLTSNLAPEVTTTDEDTETDTTTGGFNTPARMVGLIEADITRKLANSYNVLLKNINASASNSAEVSKPVATWTASHSTPYQFVMRKAGDKIQLYTKAMDYTPANAASHATYTLVREFTFNEFARMDYHIRPYWGICSGTDVVASTDWFAQAAYGDIEVQLTGATDIANNSANYTVLLKGDGRSGDPGCSRDGQFQIDTNGLMSVAGTNFPDETPITFFRAGTKLLVAGRGLYLVNSVDTGTKTVHLNMTLDHSGYFDVYALGAGTSGLWGTADSGYSKVTTTITGTTITQYLDTGAQLTDVNVGGRAFVVTDDQTAAQCRYVYTNGVNHVVVSGNETSQTCWDTTTPVDFPSSWRLLLHHGKFFNGHAADVGIETTGWMRVEDEYIRYIDAVFYKPGDNLAHSPANAVNWCVIPTYYGIIRAIDANSTVITNWTQHPYDDFGLIEDDLGGTHSSTNRIKGFLVELTARSSLTDITTNTDTTAFHVDHATYNPGGYSSITLDTAYPNAIESPVAGSTKGAVAVVSGRGQLGSDKVTHDATAPVLFYPMKMANTAPTSPLPWLIKIDCFDHFQGLYNSVEDDLRLTSAMSGIHNTTFHGLSPYVTTSYTGAPSNTPVSITTDEVSDFVLDFKAHLYGYSNIPLVIGFRDGKYSLEISAANNNSVKGSIKLALKAPLSEITATSKLLEQVTIPVSMYDLAGPSSEDVTRLIPMRLIVRKNLITVEAGYHPLWTFNLNRYVYVVDTTTSNYKYLDYGPVTMCYGASAAATITDARCLELSGEVENHIIDMDSTGSAAISFVVENRHLWSRSTQAGGMMFSQFKVRDDWCADDVDLTETVVQDMDTETNLNVAGHVVATGAEYGEYSDLAWMRLHGYSFGVSDNRLLDTVQDSRDEARLLVRLGKEQSRYRTVITNAFPDLEPQDRLDVSHPAVGSIPELVQTGYVVEQVSMTGDMNGMSAKLDLRIEQA